MKFNNSARFSNPKVKDAYNKLFWKLNKFNFENFMNKISEKVSRKSLVLTKEVLHEREQLENVISTVKHKIMQGLNKIN